MKTTPTLRLRSGRKIGHDQPCFIVAEIGNNHQGEYDLAVQMIDIAAEIGVDAVKFQKRDTQALLTAEGAAAPYTGPNSFGPTYGEHRDALELDIFQMVELKKYAEAKGLIFFASAWDSISLNQIGGLGVELLKICSADLVNVPTLRQSAAMNLPIIMSTGMSTLDEIDFAVRTLAEYHEQIVLLHCNGSYPSHDEELSLPVMHTLKKRYGFPVGYSGHERGLGPSVGAVALGACVVERHFTLDKNMRGTDHKASLEPSEFESLVRMIREVEKAVKYKEKFVFPSEKAASNKLRKSIVAAVDLKAGQVLGNGDLTVKSPGTGISPLKWDEVRGSVLTTDLPKDTMLSWDMLEKKVKKVAL